MALESGTYIQDLVVTNPTATDGKTQGDDHLRLIKNVLKTTFPNASKPLYFPTSEVKSATFTVAADDQNNTFLITTASANVEVTLPTLAAGDAGWECFFIKTNTGVNPIYVQGASGTVQSGPLSGLAKTRRAIPGVRFSALWTGTAWIISRCVGAPVGSILDMWVSTAPVGFGLATGGAFAALDYPDWSAATGGITGVDTRERVTAGLSTGGSIGRLTVANGMSSVDLGGVGGAETRTITQAHLPNILIPAAGLTLNLALNTNVLRHGGTFPDIDASSTGGSNVFSSSPSQDTITGTITGNVSLGGSGTALPTLQPTIIVAKVLVVE